MIRAFARRRRSSSGYAGENSGKLRPSPRHLHAICVRVKGKAARHDARSRRSFASDAVGAGMGAPLASRRVAIGNRQTGALFTLPSGVCFQRERLKYIYLSIFLSV